MNLTQLGKYIEYVASLVDINEATDDEVAGIATAFVFAQRHYTTKEPCPDVVRALQLTGPTLREARAGLAAALKAMPQCSADSTAITPPEVAKRLGVKPSTVIGWIKSGQLKASNLSKGTRPRYRVQPEDLAKFLEQQQPKQRVKSVRRPRKPSRF